MACFQCLQKINFAIFGDFIRADYIIFRGSEIHTGGQQKEENCIILSLEMVLTYKQTIKNKTVAKLLLYICFQHIL